MFRFYKDPLPIEQAFEILRATKNPPHIKEELIFLLATNVPEAARAPILEKINQEKTNQNQNEVSFPPLQALAEQQRLSHVVDSEYKKKSAEPYRRKI